MENPFAALNDGIVSSQFRVIALVIALSNGIVIGILERRLSEAVAGGFERFTDA